MVELVGHTMYSTLNVSPQWGNLHLGVDTIILHVIPFCPQQITLVSTEFVILRRPVQAHTHFRKDLHFPGRIWMLVCQRQYRLAHGSGHCADYGTFIASLDLNVTCDPILK